jgi:hypothetical protein
MKKKMRIKALKHSVVPLSLCASSVALGQSVTSSLLLAPNDGNIPPVALEPRTEYKNWVTMGFQLDFNVNVSFKHIGRFPAATNPGSTNGLSNHFYDDGYNLVDSTGNQHFAGFDGSGNPIYREGTWNWGFNNFAGQVNNNGDPNGTISMHSLSSNGGTSANRNDDPRPGLLLTYGRELLHDSKGHWRAGLEGAFGYTDYYIKDSSPVKANATLLTDTYSLNGTTVPSSQSYSQGSDGSPNGTIIGDTPARTLSATTVPVAGTRQFGADIFAFKLGPYIEFPLNDTFSFSLEGGPALVYVFSNLRFNEQVVTPAGLMNVKGNNNHQDVKFGGYLGGRISAALNDQWSLYAGAQWQDVGNYVHPNHATGESAVLNLSQAVFFSAGIGYSF